MLNISHQLSTYTHIHVAYVYGGGWVNVYMHITQCLCGGHKRTVGAGKFLSLCGSR